MCLGCVWLRGADAGRPGTKLKLPRAGGPRWFWDDIIGRIGPARGQNGLMFSQAPKTRERKCPLGKLLATRCLAARVRSDKARRVTWRPSREIIVNSALCGRLVAHAPAPAQDARRPNDLLSAIHPSCRVFFFGPSLPGNERDSDGLQQIPAVTQRHPHFASVIFHFSVSSTTNHQQLATSPTGTCQVVTRPPTRHRAGVRLLQWALHSGCADPESLTERRRGISTTENFDSRCSSVYYVSGRLTPRRDGPLHSSTSVMAFTVSPGLAPSTVCSPPEGRSYCKLADSYLASWPCAL